MAADGRAESPLESVSRLVLRWLALPTPDLQTTLCDRNGVFLGRADFYWDEFGVAGEADGRLKYEDRDVLTAEKLRQEALEDPGVAIVRWGWRDAQYRPRPLGDRIVQAFERGRRRDRSGFPPPVVGSGVLKRTPAGKRPSDANTSGEKTPPPPPPDYSRPASRMPLSVGGMIAVGTAPSLTASIVFRPSPVL